MKWPWVGGNAVDLLENGEQYFPAVYEAIEQARRDVYIETFILFDDSVGRRMREVLIEAADRGVDCHLLLDGYGSSELSAEFIEGLTGRGVRIHYFDPVVPLFGRRAKMFRRMHRKLVVVDGELAFCGGLNFSMEHLYDFGQRSKQDYAVRLRGPIVRWIYDFVRTYASRQQGGEPSRARHPNAYARPVGCASVRLVVRDNEHERSQIEEAYLAGIRAARERIIIANAYFFPGYRVLRELRRAARRRVDVRLILQGRPDKPYVMYAARMVYGFLLDGGVSVYEYGDRPLHGKVALVDHEWATVGSSNLDPLSLSLNLEANVLIRDRQFNAELYGSLERIMSESCVRVEAESLPRTTWWQFLRGRVVFHFLRRFPAWFDLLPAHTPRLALIAPPEAAARDDGTPIAAPAAGPDGVPPPDGVAR